MKLRDFSTNTIQAYLNHNQKFLEFCKKDPNNVSEIDVKEYIGHLMTDKRLKPAPINLILSALKFYYSHVLQKEVL
ncbi:phage integrase N-terminal SAM-like domain-containing protein [Candidatus Woesearchaeota archaeon]|nr:phage integrase N-terminal SAM-like domain-containing protein [Candidatus Woesearchaeota archaeon]